MTKRDKIIKYLADNGLDILAHEEKDSVYAVTGAIVIGGFIGHDSDFCYKVEALTGYKTGKKSPIEVKKPYKKDAFGNVNWFEHDWCHARVIWVGD